MTLEDFRTEIDKLSEKLRRMEGVLSNVRFHERGWKTANQGSRKMSLWLEKLLKEWRKISVAFEKQ